VLCAQDFFLQVKREDLMGTKVIFRQGSPLQGTELKRVSAHTARSILVLAPADGAPDSADAQTLRTVLALNGLTEGLEGHIVAEVRDVDNEYLICMVGGQNLETLVSHDVVGRLMIMSARQPGLSDVYSVTLGFDGDEFYMQEWPEITGLAFGELAVRFPNASPIGVKRPAHKGGEVIMCPPMRYKMQTGDELIVIAEDDDTYKPMPPMKIGASQPPPEIAPDRQKEAILITGWRRDLRDVLKMLDVLVVKGSTITIMAQVPLSERNDRLLAEGLDPRTLQNAILLHHDGNSSSRKHLGSLPIETVTSVMILADEAHENDILHSDSNSLATLLLFRDLFNVQHDALQVNSSVRLEKKQVPMICEILDPRTQKTIMSNALVQRASDFLQTNQLVSQILAMISENRSVKNILGELLGSKGADLGALLMLFACLAAVKLTRFDDCHRNQTGDQILLDR
jgi:hypothetical protein